MKFNHNAKYREMAEKYQRLFELSTRFIQILQEKKSIEEFLLKKDIKSIGIYGMNHLGERLFEELKNSSVTVRWGIDQEAHMIYIPGITLHTLAEELEAVDAVIVTPVTYFEKIKDDLQKKVSGGTKIISLEDFLYAI